METPLIIKEKRNHKDNTDEASNNKKRKSISKYKDNLSHRMMAAKINNIEQTSQLLTIIKKDFFKKTSRNMIGYVTYFLSISECFKFLNIDKRSRNIILDQNKLFSLYIQLKKTKSLTFDSIFKQAGFHPDCSELEVFKANKIEDQLSKKETEFLFREFFYSITNAEFFDLNVKDDITLKYIKILFSHPECVISRIHFTKKSLISFSNIDDILAINNSIQRLVISDFEFNKEDVNVLKVSLENNKNIKDIFITSPESYKENVNKFFNKFLNIFNKNSSVENLDIMGHGSGMEKLFINLSQFIKNNHTIKSLVISDFELNGSLDLLYDAILNNNTLEDLYFVICNFDNLHCSIFSESEGLPFVSSLKHLSFLGCMFSDEEEIANVLLMVEKIPNLESLDLSRIPLISSPIALIIIISIITNNKSIKELNLSCTDIKNEEFQAICEALLINNTLTSVDLSENLFFCSVNEINELFKVNKTLKEFDVKGAENNEEAAELIKMIMLDR